MTRREDRARERARADSDEWVFDLDVRRGAEELRLEVGAYLDSVFEPQLDTSPTFMLINRAYRVLMQVEELADELETRDQRIRDLIGGNQWLRDLVNQRDADLSQVQEDVLDLNAENGREKALLEMENDLLRKQLKAAKGEERAERIKLLAEGMEARRTYMAEHDERPTYYLGYKQPGASPSFYGPDSVVVDGDWLQDRLKQADLLAEQMIYISDELEAARIDGARTALGNFAGNANFKGERFQRMIREWLVSELDEESARYLAPAPTPASEPEADHDR